MASARSDVSRKGDRETETVDVVIVGSGAAGLTAALAAAVAGASVVILEKTDKIGGTSAMSGAAAWVPANHHARAAGIEDSPEEALQYLRSSAPAGWADEEDTLWQSLAFESAEMLSFVEQHTPLRFALTNEADVFVELPGGKAHGRMVAPLPLPRRIVGRYRSRLRGSTLPHIFTYQETTENDLYRKPFRTVLKLAPALGRRLLAGARSKGTALVAGLLKGCLDRGCRIETEARVVELLCDEAGAVVGVAVQRKGQRHQLIARRGVLLATGGFEWNRELVSEHFPGPLGIPGSPRGNEGDAIKLAQQVDAQLARMDQALIFSCVPTRYEGKLHSMPLPFHMESNAILVNRDGRRFVSELAVDVGEALDQRDPTTGQPLNLPAWMITDSRFRRPALRWYARQVPGWIRTAPTIEALAELIGLVPEALRATVERFNSFCSDGRDADFGRGETFFQRKKAGGRPHLLPIDHPPYVAVLVERCILSTKGGVRTDRHGRVMSQNSAPIAGLYCAGAAMANPIGTRAISAGTTIGPNMTWGFICARHMMAPGAR